MSGRKFKFALLMRVLICVICVGSMIGLAFMDSLFYVHAPGDVVTTAAFEPYPKEGTSENGRKTLEIYNDISPNMRGFYSRAREECFSSSYADMLGSLEDTFQEYDLKYYHFLRSRISACKKDELCPAENGADMDGSAEGGLIHVLEMIVQDDLPAVVFTDLEGDYVSEEFREDWQRVCKSAFQKRKSVSIIRYMSAYGGIIKNYAGSSTNYGYGFRLPNNGRGTGAKQLKPQGRYFHLLPRAFYAIVIGNADVSKQVVDALNSSYDRVCRLAKNRDCHDLPAWESYQAKDMFVLPIVESNVISTCQTDPRAAGIYVNLNGLQEKILKDTKLRDQYGVYSFMVKHTAHDDGGFSIPFTVTPALRSYNAKALFTQLSTRIEVTKLNEYGKKMVQDENMVLAEDTLLARGDRIIRLALEPYAPVAGCFRAEATAQASGKVQVEFVANTKLVTQGIYRVKLHVYAKQDGKRMADALENPLNEYSIKYADAKNAAAALCEEDMRLGNPMLNTPDLRPLLEDLRSSYATVASENEMEIAQMIFDLYVE